MLIEDNKGCLSKKNNLKIYLDYSGKEQKIPQNIRVIKDALLKITDKNDQYLVLRIGD